MTPVTQTVFHRPECDRYHGLRGNCLRACLATIFGGGIDEIPPFEWAKGLWWGEFQRWAIETHRLKPVLFQPHQPPPGWSLMNGPTGRGVRHSVVARDGAMVFDPHPSRAGLLAVEDFIGFTACPPAEPDVR